jgi:integrase
MEAFNLTEFIEKLQPQNIKHKNSRERMEAAITRFLCHTGLRGQELIKVRKQDCQVLEDKASGEKTVVITIVSAKNPKRTRTVYCPYILYTFLRFNSGHPTLLFSRRTRKAPCGYAPYCLRRIQNVVWKTSRKFKTTLSIEKIRGEGIKNMLQDHTISPKMILRYFDISQDRFQRLIEQLYSEHKDIVA